MISIYVLMISLYAMMISKNVGGRVIARDVLVISIGLVMISMDVMMFSQWKILLIDNVLMITFLSVSTSCV